MACAHVGGVTTRTTTATCRVRVVNNHAQQHVHIQQQDTHLCLQASDGGCRGIPGCHHIHHPTQPCSSPPLAPACCRSALSIKLALQLLDAVALCRGGLRGLAVERWVVGTIDEKQGRKCVGGKNGNGFDWYLAAGLQPTKIWQTPPRSSRHPNTTHLCELGL